VYRRSTVPNDTLALRCCSCVFATRISIARGMDAFKWSKSVRRYIPWHTPNDSRDGMKPPTDCPDSDVIFRSPLMPLAANCGQTLNADNLLHCLPTPPTPPKGCFTVTDIRCGRRSVGRNENEKHGRGKGRRCRSVFGRHILDYRVDNSRSLRDGGDRPLLGSIGHHHHHRRRRSACVRLRSLI